MRKPPENHPWRKGYKNIVKGRPSILKILKESGLKCFDQTHYNPQIENNNFTGQPRELNFEH